MELPKRKINRLRGYDYSRNGVYFITICVDKRKNILSDIEKLNFVGDGFPVPKLKVYGEIVDKAINEINNKYENVYVDTYIIMPNHIHLLLVIDNDGTGNPSPTAGNVMGWFKYITTKEVNKIRGTQGEKLWQRSYYDHIIRNEADYMEKAEYILTNPIRWVEDEYYC